MGEMVLLGATRSVRPRPCAGATGFTRKPERNQGGIAIGLRSVVHPAAAGLFVESGNGYAHVAASRCGTMPRCCGGNLRAIGPRATQKSGPQLVGVVLCLAGADLLEQVAQ
jgi:hypothetical protein